MNCILLIGAGINLALSFFWALYETKCETKSALAESCHTAALILFWLSLVIK